MELEHIMEKELILNDKSHEKLEYNKCLTISEVEQSQEKYVFQWKGRGSFSTR